MWIFWNVFGTSLFLPLMLGMLIRLVPRRISLESGLTLPFCVSTCFPTFHSHIPSMTRMSWVHAHGTMSWSIVWWRCMHWLKNVILTWWSSWRPWWHHNCTALIRVWTRNNYWSARSLRMPSLVIWILNPIGVYSSLRKGNKLVRHRMGKPSTSWRRMIDFLGWSCVSAIYRQYSYSLV